MPKIRHDGRVAVPGFEEGAAEFADLAVNLRLVGQDGLRRELYKAISNAAAPLARKIKDPARLDEYLPKRYAYVLSADLKVTTYKRTGTDPGVTIAARAPTGGSGGRKIRATNAGLLRHPVFADRGAPRRSWRWRDQDVRAGWFDDPAAAAAPRVRAEILAAVERIGEMALGR
jgi:hypothetical protein